jgi:hypothetical protein
VDEKHYLAEESQWCKGSRPRKLSFLLNFFCFAFLFSFTTFICIFMLILQIETDHLIYGTAKKFTIPDGENDCWVRSDPQKLVINDNTTVFVYPGDTVVIDSNDSVAFFRCGKCMSCISFFSYLLIFKLFHKCNWENLSTIRF